MTLSVVIPTYNEAADIAGTLDAVLAVACDDLEVLVVDASSDDTPAIVAGRPQPAVRLIRQTRGRGRAAARNEGLLAARGDIVILLNADVRLPADFARRILPHYAAGADYVLVESRVANLEAATGRYIQARHAYDYPARPDTDARINWTEGFSCRRAAAIAVGLFPEGEHEPLSAGEDGWFGERLEAAGFRKVIDRSIVVTHVAPARLGEFWRQRVGRGRGWPQILRDRERWDTARVRRVALKVAAREIPALAVPVRSVWRGLQLARCSPRRADWLAMAALEWVDSAARLTGLLAGAFGAARP